METNYEDGLMELDEKLEEAIRAAKNLATLSKKNKGPGWLHGQLEAYTIGTLEAFRSSTYQPGSVASLQRALEKQQ